MDTFTFLSRIFLFESLNSDQLEMIEAASSVKNFDHGKLLFTEGQPATAFFILVNGSVKIYKLSADGNEQILHIQHSGDLIAEAIIFDFEHYPAFCQAIEDTVLIRIGKTEFLKILRRFPEMSFKIMSAYSRRLRQLLHKIEELSLRDIKSRLANYILLNATFRDNHEVCPLLLTKKNLAAVLGTIPETLSRTLNYFKKEKIITEQGNYLFILDRKKLEAIGE